MSYIHKKILKKFYTYKRHQRDPTRLSDWDTLLTYLSRYCCQSSTHPLPKVTLQSYLLTKQLFPQSSWSYFFVSMSLLALTVALAFSMANLLSKFRIDYSSLTMVQDITEAPQEETKKMFDELVSKYTTETASEGNLGASQGLETEEKRML